ncbi:MAG: hypothetical protein GKR90_14160 [Pseudomonadales bacterium]|nr:hypothetical protein [Pseudomonadales bacterium]
MRRARTARNRYREPRPCLPNRIMELDGVRRQLVGRRHCVGVEREATILGMSLDTYFQRIVTRLEQSRLSQPLKGDVVQSAE